MNFNDLSGAAKDTLYKLGKYGNQDDGDLPSKCGMNELVELGLAFSDCQFFTKPHLLTLLGKQVYNNYIEYLKVKDILGKITYTSPDYHFSNILGIVHKDKYYPLENWITHDQLIALSYFISNKELFEVIC